VSGNRRLPCPPPRMMASTERTAQDNAIE
jgi:hypothetical protein